MSFMLGSFLFIFLTINNYLVEPLGEMGEKIIDTYIETRISIQSRPNRYRSPSQARQYPKEKTELKKKLNKML